MNEIVSSRPAAPGYARRVPASDVGDVEGSAMPIYEFECQKCEETFEIMGSYAEREQAHACPKCGSADVRQAISLFSAKPPSSTF